MSWFVESLLSFHNWYNSVPKIQAALSKSPNPIRLGILSAAAINNVAIFDPVASHPDIVVTGLAARSKAKAQAQVQRYKLQNVQVYESYDDLLDDKSIDAVYIPLPNGLHEEWAIKAMEKGKHVLIEKPIAANANQVRNIRDVADKTGVIALEAFHWRFHPAAHLVKQMVSGGDYGDVLAVDTVFKLSAGTVGEGDIRFNYDLAGGASMDLVYVFSAMCYFASLPTPKGEWDVQSARARSHPKDKRIDEAMKATIEIRTGKEINGGPHAIKCTVDADLAMSKWLGFVPRFWDATPFVVIDCQEARIEYNNFVVPWLMHSVSITPKDESGKLLTAKKIKTKCYTGGPEWGEGIGQPWWTTYRYQLEAFVNRVKAAKNGQAAESAGGPWVDLADSQVIMSVVDSVYEAAGIGKRGT